MDSDGTRFAAITETTSFLHYFSGLPDHRQAGKVDYPLLLPILLAVLAGADAFTDIAIWRAENRTAATVSALCERHTLA